jgi:hypothetical protein
VNYLVVALGSLVVIAPKVRGLKPGRGRLIFKGDKVRSRTAFGGEVKPSAPCRKILRHVKNPYSMKEIFRSQNSRIFITCFSCFATRCLLVTARELWWVNQE